MPRLQQLALAQAGVAAHEDVDVAAHGHGVPRAHALAHAAQQRQHQARLQAGQGRVGMKGSRDMQDSPLNMPPISTSLLLCIGNSQGHVSVLLVAVREGEG